MSHSEVQELLAAWREALRECEVAAPGSDDWEAAHARAVDLSSKYRIAVLRMMAHLDQLEARTEATDGRLRGAWASIEHANETLREHSAD